MKLFIKPLLKRLREQYPLGKDLKSQKVIVKIFHPLTEHGFYILNQNPDNPDQLRAIVKDFNLEVTEVSMKTLQKYISFNYPLERDHDFEPTPAEHVWNKLQNGEPI